MTTKNQPPPIEIIRLDENKKIMIKINIDTLAKMNPNFRAPRTEQKGYIIEFTTRHNFLKKILEINPLQPIEAILAKLIREGHIFHDIRGKPLAYNGGDAYGLIFKDADGRTLRIHKTLEYKVIMIMKLIISLTAYLVLTAPLRKIAEFFNTPYYLLEELARNLEDPESVEINIDEPYVVTWGKERVLVVFMDGARAGGGGIEVAVSGQYRLFCKASEYKPDETFAGVKHAIRRIMDREKCSRVMFVVDGRREVANWIINTFGESAIIVECSHRNPWEVCVIYSHEKKWYTIRMRSDFTSNVLMPDPDIPLLPGEVEVYEGIRHVGSRTKKKKKLSEKELEELKKSLLYCISQIPRPRCSSVRASREFQLWLAVWVARVKEITQILRSHGVDLSCFITLAKEKVLELCKYLKEKFSGRDLRRLVNALLNALSRLAKTEYRPLINVVADFFHRSARKYLERAKKTRAKRSGAKKRSSSGSSARGRAVLIYKGPACDAPDHAKKILNLIRIVFSGRFITSNNAEREIGTHVRMVRVCRGTGKVMLRLWAFFAPIEEVLDFVVRSFRLGRGRRGVGPRMRVNGVYKVWYGRGGRFLGVLRIVDRRGRYVVAVRVSDGGEFVLRRDRIFRFYPADVS